VDAAGEVFSMARRRQRAAVLDAAEDVLKTGTGEHFGGGAAELPVACWLKARARPGRR